MKMTRFEKRSLHTLLFMYEEELKENGISFNGDKVKEEKIQEFIKKVEEIRILIGMAD